MKLNRKLVLILALVVSSVVTITGTLAYLTDRDSETNVFTMGNVQIDLVEDFEQGATLIPNQTITKIPTIKNTGNNDAWVWMFFSIPAALDNWNPGTEEGSSNNIIHWNPTGATAEGYVDQERVDKAIEQGLLPAGTTAEEILNANKTWDVFNTLLGGVNCYRETINGVEYNSYVLPYNKALTPGEETLPCVYQVYLDEFVDIDPEGKLHVVKNGVVTDVNWDVDENGAPIIYCSAYAIQKDGFENVEDAFAAYFQQWGENGFVSYPSTQPTREPA